MRRHVLIMLMCLLVFNSLSNADKVLFKNGDQPTGKIEHFVDGKLTFKSDVIGTVSIDISNIQTLSSDAPIKVHLKDGTVLNQKVYTSKPGWFAIEGGETLKAQEFELGTISSINPPPIPEPKWTGDTSAGFTSTHGNTKTDTVSASANLKKRTEKDRTQLSADYARGRQEDPDTGKKKTTEDWWRAKAKYDHFFTKKLYGYIDSRYDKDATAELGRRVIVGGGCGYQWIESEDWQYYMPIYSC